MQQTQLGQRNRVGARNCQMVVAALALWAIPAVASAHGGNNDAGMVHACIGHISKVVRVVGVGGTCIPAPPLLAETPAHWPQVQGAGTPGPKGDKGDKGDPGIGGIDGTSVIFAGAFEGNQNGCPNGGAIFAAGAVSAYVCNGRDSAAGAARPDGPCFDNINRYVDCGNGTVTDTLTGLIWLKQADCLGAADWATANQDAAVLASGDCAGTANPLADGSSAGDWRLASKEEWTATIADCGGLCTSTPFAGLPGGLGLFFFWSYNSSQTDPASAWAQDVGPSFSALAERAKSGPNRAWPVRGGSR